MLTKTFRAQNMLLALQNVQAELGPNALIISMREVPAGPIWATWKKPGVEVIASRPDSSKPEPEPTSLKRINDRPLPTPTHGFNQEDLKKEIENLKKLVAGQKPVTDTSTLPLADDVQSPARVEVEEINKESSQFSELDFKPLPQDKTIPPSSHIEKNGDIVAKNEPLKTIVQKEDKQELPYSLANMQDLLVLQGLHEQIIQKVIHANMAAISPAILEDYSRLERFIKHQLIASLPTSRKSLALVPSHIMALVGTSGSGKTSSCAKLASFYMITMGKRVVWIEADTVRTSAISEARTYCETLGIPLYLAYTPQELSELISAQKDADLIIVDTAGCNPRNEDSVVELGSYLSVLSPGCTYLVTSATTKEQDLIQTEKTLKPFGLKGVIMTKMDETGTFGACFNLLWQSRLPVYFYSSGKQIFGNLKPGNPEQLANAVVDGYFSS